MTDVFLRVMNMSISASWMLLAVLGLRLALKKAPKWLTVALWGLVALRLICPFSFESWYSLVPNAKTVRNDFIPCVTTQISNGYSMLNSVLYASVGESVTEFSEASTGVMEGLAVVWPIGMLVIIGYAVTGYYRLKQRVATAVLLKDNVYQSEHVTSPFVLGIVSPKIYLPYNTSAADLPLVLAHEQAHIRRKDHWWKPLGFLVLAIHWQNPLVWLGYALLCKDIELACDELVIKGLNSEKRADYSQAILACSVNRRYLDACPLAFGEVGVKGRVKYVLGYKRAAAWVIAVATAVSLAVVAVFFANPISEQRFGVNSLSAKRVDANTLTASIGYTYGYGKYSIRNVPRNEGEYTGDGMIDYDGSIGEYRILIEFGDAYPSGAFMDKFLAGKLTEGFPIEARARIAMPQDHGFVLYLGFDRPVYVVDVASKPLSELGGTIKFKISTP